MALPVTAADLESERILMEGLSRYFPEIPIMSEESYSTASGAIHPSRFFLVDPLDGTQDFVAGRDEFTVNVALIEDGSPRFGILGAPAIGRLFIGSSGNGAFERQSDGSLT